MTRRENLRHQPWGRTFHGCSHSSKIRRPRLCGYQIFASFQPVFVDYTTDFSLRDIAAPHHVSLLKVPSGYYICDVFLYLDALCNKRLFKPDSKQFETRSSLAAEEAVKVKKCLGTLRYLWRNASGGSHDENVQTMKSFLCPSPLQKLRQGPGDEDGPLLC